MKHNDIRVNMENLNEKEREYLLKLIEKANNGKRLSDITIGETFKIADIEFIKFAEENGNVTAVAKDFVFNDIFGSDYNFATSSLLKRLQKEILPQIKAEVGANNVLEFETDLTSLDGSDECGILKSKISLPTFDFYRENVKIFDKYNPNPWWWLATPWSTKAHGWHSTVCRVNYDGSVDGYLCTNSFGARPFCIFKSSIFVS